MRRTTVNDLAIPFAVVGIFFYVLLQLTYDSLPPFEWLTAVPFPILAVLEFVIARRIRAVLRHSPEAKPIAAVSIAKAVALGKSTALVAAGVAGAALALMVKVAPDAGRTRAADNDIRVAGVLLAATAALVMAGLWLERAGIDPEHRSNRADEKYR